MTKHPIQQELKLILSFVAVLWLVYFVDYFIPGSLTRFGLLPRSLQGLVGIATMPFLHANLGHLIGNSIPLVILLSLMAGSRTDSFRTTLGIGLLGGGLLWLFGTKNLHVGASGLIYGLITFLLLAGYLEKRFIAIVVAIVVLVLYGTTLIFGVIPKLGSNVSWDGHLLGAIAGGLVAIFEAKLLKAESNQTETHAKL